MTCCKLADTVKDPTPDALHRQIAKEAFDHVQPRGTGGDPGGVKTLAASQPLLHLWSFVSRVVVHDQMDCPVRRCAAFNEFEKPNPVPTIVCGHGDVNYASMSDVHGNDQSGGPVPLVVMGHGPAATLFPG